MAGAMRKMAVYLGLVEDDGYDGPGFDPDDEFEPEPEPERSRRPHQSHQPPHQTQPEEPARIVHAPAPGNPGSPQWHPSHKNAIAWRRTRR